MKKIHCTQCDAEIDIEYPYDGDVEKIQDDIDLIDKLTINGNANGIGRDREPFILCELCTDKMAYE